VYTPPITNQGSFPVPRVNRPIHEMDDEYVSRGGRSPMYDEAERSRVAAELSMRTPEQLERKARETLASYGIDTSRRSSTYMLLGRGAFAATQTIGAFGIRQVDGTLSSIGIG